MHLYNRCIGLFLVGLCLLSPVESRGGRKWNKDWTGFDGLLTGFNLFDGSQATVKKRKVSTTKFGRIFVEHRSIHDLGSSGKKPDPNSARERVVFFIEPTGEKSILDWLQFRKHDALPPEKVAFDIYPIQWSDDWKLMPSQGESAHPFTALEMRALQQAIRAYFFQEFRRSVRFQ